MRFSHSCICWLSMTGDFAPSGRLGSVTRYSHLRAITCSPALMSAAPAPYSKHSQFRAGPTLWKFPLSFGWCQEGSLRFIVIQEVGGPESEWSPQCTRLDPGAALRPQTAHSFDCLDAARPPRIHSSACLRSISRAKRSEEHTLNSSHVAISYAD